MSTKTTAAATTDISDRVSAIKTDLNSRKEAMLNRVPQFASEHSAPAFSLGEVSASKGIELPGEVRDKVAGLKDVLAKLGLHQRDQSTASSSGNQERYAVSSVQGATLPHSPSSKEKSEVSIGA